METDDRLSGLSNCCMAPILDEQDDGTGICWHCKDGCLDINKEENDVSTRQLPSA